jgi:hypothetical protein
LESSIIASQGGYDSTNFISLEWTLGENVVDRHAKEPNYILGVQTYFSKSKVVRKRNV